MPSPRHEEVHPLFDARAIAARVDELAREIAARGFCDPLIVSVLKGGFVFTADLARALERHGVDVEITFLALSSYGRGTRSLGHVTVRYGPDMDVAGRDVILVEDLLDTGRTLRCALDLLRDAGARQIATTAIIDKPQCREIEISCDHVGFLAPDVFIVGYGIDMGEKYRGLPFIGHVVGGTG